MLRHFKWSAQGVWERWCSDELHVRDVVGLPVDGIVVSMAVNDAPLARDIYLDVDAPDEMRSVGRAHLYCRGCWSGNVWAADGDGARCL
uniref:Uncharacterized protein n=1 Tax=Aegilops tauschii subsp. strangulata TaxID=200361 RepID=A0A453M7A7_AEGTS